MNSRDVLMIPDHLGVQMNFQVLSLHVCRSIEECQTQLCTNTLLHSISRRYFPGSREAPPGPPTTDLRTIRKHTTTRPAQPSTRICSRQDRNQSLAQFEKKIKKKKDTLSRETTKYTRIYLQGTIHRNFDENITLRIRDTRSRIES